MQTKITDFGRRQQTITTHLGRAWTKIAGQTRYYIDNAWQYGGLELDFYKTGNIAGALYHGERISHAEAGRMASSFRNAWIDEAGEVHLKDASSRYAGFHEEIVAGIKAADAAFRAQMEA